MDYLNRVEHGKKQNPIFVLLYGTDGIGKTTWAAAAPNPIFICSETGTNHMDVARFPRPKTFQEIVNMVDELQKKPHDFKTLVLDSLDWAEPLVWAEICSEEKVKSIDELSYGKGYNLALQRWQILMHKLKILREKMNVILIAHAIVRTFQDPQTNSGYDRYELKLNSKASGLIREAVDACLFATYEVFTKKDGQKVRAYGEGGRIILTERRPSHDAKNRYGLPYQLPLDFEEFIQAVGSGQPSSPSEIKQRIMGLLQNLTDDKLKAQVNEYVLKASDDAIRLRQIEERVRVKVES